MLTESPIRRTESERPPDVAEAVRSILSLPEEALDPAPVKLALDRIVDPAADAGAAAATIDRMAAEAARLAGRDAPIGARLDAIRRLLHDNGPWNDHRPFGYDQDDPAGTRITGKLLHVYLATRRGNCVSMPILFLILAGRLGLDVALARAPQHIFVKLRLPDGAWINLETTSGGHPARDEWYAHNFPMRARALASGLYMRPLGRRAQAALMASTVLEHLSLAGRHEEVIAVARIILTHDPTDAHALVVQADAYGRLLQVEFAERYPVPFLIPEARRTRRLMLVERSRSLLAAAAALGWDAEE